MWTLTFIVALSLVCATDVSGENVMGRLNWCKTLCMCRDDTHVEVQCFGRGDIYQLLDFKKIQVIRLERANWQLENQVLWCNDTCLCHQNDNQKIFKCVEPNILKQFISERIGDEYFYAEGDPEELPQDVATDEERREVEHRRRQEERRRNRGKNRKQRKRKNKQEVTTTTSTTALEITTTVAPTTTPPEIVEIVTTLPTEAVSTTVQESVEVDDHGGWFWHTPSPVPSVHTSDLTTTSSTVEVIDDSDDLLVPEPEPSVYVATQDPLEDEYPAEEEEEELEEELEEEEEEDLPNLDDYVIEDYNVGLLPKQEAVAASPAVTAMQPPTRRMPFPPTTSSQTAMRDVETPAPKVSAVLEFPVQRKTVASEVSQDLDDLENAVMDIKNDVVLNQRILLVTVAVAGIAMLGVIVLAIYTCMASKRQAAAAEDRRGPKDPPKEDNHVTKVNLEEAW